MPNMIPFNEIKILSVQEENSDVNFVFMYQDFMYRLVINSDKEIRTLGKDTRVL